MPTSSDRRSRKWRLRETKSVRFSTCSAPLNSPWPSSIVSSESQSFNRHIDRQASIMSAASNTDTSPSPSNATAVDSNALTRYLLEFEIFLIDSSRAASILGTLQISKISVYRSIATNDLEFPRLLARVSQSVKKASSSQLSATRFFFDRFARSDSGFSNASTNETSGATSSGFDLMTRRAELKEQISSINFRDEMDALEELFVELNGNVSQRLDVRYCVPGQECENGRSIALERVISNSSFVSLSRLTIASPSPLTITTKRRKTVCASMRLSASRTSAPLLEIQISSPIARSINAFRSSLPMNSTGMSDVIPRNVNMCRRMTVEVRSRNALGVFFPAMAPSARAGDRATSADTDSSSADWNCSE